MRLKVMLVDDEILVRLGIKSLIDWDKHGFDYVGDAPDGKQALEAMERSAPDILLTDIVMPNMNGLELIEAVRKRYPYTRIIVLSSHNEYEYVRTAMKRGVDDYILKASMKPDELLALLVETADKIAAGRREVERRLGGETQESGGSDAEGREAAKLRLLHDWLEGRRPQAGTETGGSAGTDAAAGLESGDRALAIALAASNAVMLLQVHGGQPSSPNGGPSMRTLLNLLELELQKWTPGCVLPYREHEVVLLIPFSSAPANAQDMLMAIGSDLASAAKRFLSVTVSVGISGVFAQAEEVRAAYGQAKRALQAYFYNGKGSVSVSAAAAAAAEGALPVPISKEDEQKLKLAVGSMDEQAMKDIVSGVFDRLYERKEPVESAIRICLELLHFLQTEWRKYDELMLEGLEEKEPLYKKVLAFEELGEARGWFDWLIAVCGNRAREVSRGTYREEIGRLLAYVKEHIADDWSLRKAAEVVNMNESYLSYLFKKETNTGFVEYVNQIRADKAAELLLETNLPSYAIAEQVGYDNINYFGRVFKKIKGVSPQQYRAQFQPRTPTS
ncbi:response regulator [Paenibacillus sp. MBLB4367]|uniref:response regulator n=1 Tax=Paenibacillus sp. MBLB4367 TaxID=3384767 RepID=UPI00390820E2